MSRTVVQVDALQEYLLRVLDRASHHAGNVREAILTVAGAVVLFKDPSYPKPEHTVVARRTCCGYIFRAFDIRSGTSIIIKLLSFANRTIRDALLRRSTIRLR